MPSLENFGWETTRCACFFFARTFALEKFVKGRICGKTSFLGLGSVVQASLLADNKSVKGVRCKLTIVAASPPIAG